MPEPANRRILCAVFLNLRPAELTYGAMLNHWHSFELPPLTTLGVWTIVIVSSLAAVALSFFLVERLEKR